MTDTLRHARMLLAFAAGAHSDRTNIEGHDLNQLQVSQLFASHGLAVVPSHGLKDGRCACDEEKKCKHPGRHPRTIHGLQDATTDGELIHQFWTRWPKAKVIVATGQQGVIAVTATGRKGDQALASLVDNDAVETLEFREGRLHTLLLNAPEDAIPNGRVRLATGVLVHGRGSFIVVPRNVRHPGRYKQLFDREIAPAPGELLKLLGAPAASHTPDPGKLDQIRRLWNAADPDRASSEGLASSEPEDTTMHQTRGLAERTFDETLRFELKMLDLDWIVIPDGTPPCNEDKVRALAESYRITNVPAPLTVRVLTFRTKDAWPTVRLLSDPYELETLKRLGIKCAECFVVEGDTGERLWRLARLIYHPEVKCLARAPAVMEWVGLTREKGGQVAHPPGGKQPHDKGFSAAERVLGVSRRDLRRFSRIASISAEAQEIARGAGLDAIQIALEEIADEPPEQQAAKALELKERYRKPRRNRAASAETNASTDAQQGPVVEDQPAPGAAPSADESDQQEEEQDDQQHPAVESPAIAPADASEGTNEPPSVLDRRPDEDEKFERFKFRWEQYLADDWEQETERFHRRFIKTVLGYSVMPMSKAGKSHG